MSTHIYSQIKTAFQHLNPRQVREDAEQPISVGLIAANSAGYAAMEDFLAPPSISHAKRYELVNVLHRAGDPGAPDSFDVAICDAGAPCPRGGFSFYREDPGRTVREILAAKEDLALPLARHFLPFRRPVADRIIKNVSKENAVFSVMTALPDVIPSFIELPWAVSEFASDTAFLTMNQVRMAFLMAGASDHTVGYKEQGAQIAAIVGGAFGWRTLARELVGKIPFGAGLIPKAAIAYAGTYVVGTGLERYFRLGRGLSRDERHVVYQDAFEKGKRVVTAFLDASKIRTTPT
jgi:hypothetical protein